MFDELYRFLSHTVPRQKVEQVRYITDTLYAQFGDTLDTPMGNIISQVNQQETIVTLIQLYDFFLMKLDEGLRSYGIFINEDIVTHNDLESLTDILDTFIELPTYEDIDAVLNILDIREETADTVQQLVQLISGKPLDYLPYLTKVNDGIVIAIDELYQERIRASAPQSESVEISKELEVFIASGMVKYVQPDILKILSSQPHTLNLNSILRLYGNKMADDKAGYYTWVFAVLVAAQPITLNDLFAVWSRYFLEESDLLQMKQKIDAVYKQLQDKMVEYGNGE